MEKNLQRPRKQKVNAVLNYLFSSILMIYSGCVREVSIYFSGGTKRTTERFPRPQHPITDTSVANKIQIQIQFFILLAIYIGI